MLYLIFLNTINKVYVLFSHIWIMIFAEGSDINRTGGNFLPCSMIAYAGEVSYGSMNYFTFNKITLVILFTY